jgi:hypothetical protein
MATATCTYTTNHKIINFNEARGPDPGFRHRWLDRLQDDPDRRQSTFSVAYALARRIDPKKAAPEVWPGIESIAGMAQVSISTAKTELKWLHDRGWLAFGKRRPKYVVRVLTMPEVADPPATSQPVVADPPATVVAGPPATITTIGTSPPTKDDHKANNPERCASGSAGDEKPLTVYRQSKVEADRAFDQLKQMPWRKAGDGYEPWRQAGDEEFDPSPTVDRGAEVRWYRLLKSGHAANRIMQSAELYFHYYQIDRVQTLAAWLASEEFSDPESELFVPEHHHHGHHGAHA